GVGGMVLLRARLPAPGPARAHLVPFDRAALTGLRVQGPETPEDLFLADFPLGALDKLEDADRETLVPPAQRHPERGRGLPLPGARVHGGDGEVATLPGGEAVVGDGVRIEFSLCHDQECRSCATVSCDRVVRPRGGSGARCRRTVRRGG